MDLGLRDKAALVTGGNSGIGLATVEALAQEGVAVAINYLERPEAAEEIAASIRAAGGSAECFQADVSQPQAVSQMVQQVLDRFGRLDILVNNAGYLKVIPLEAVTFEQWNDTLQVNLGGTFNCTQAVLDLMKEQGSGRIINMSALAGKGGNQWNAHYAASKAGIIALTRATAEAMAPYGVTVNAVAPGIIKTQMGQDVLESLGEGIIDFIPLGRMGLPQDVAATVVFLASELASYITGETVSVNGGLFMD